MNGKLKAHSNSWDGGGEEGEEEERRTPPEFRLAASVSARNPPPSGQSKINRHVNRSALPLARSCLIMDPNPSRWREREELPFIFYIDGFDESAGR